MSSCRRGSQKSDRIDRITVSVLSASILRDYPKWKSRRLPPVDPSPKSCPPVQKTRVPSPPARPKITVEIGRAVGYIQTYTHSQTTRLLPRLASLVFRSGTLSPGLRCCATAPRTGDHLLIETEMPPTTPKKPVLLSPSGKYARRKTRLLRQTVLSPIFTPSVQKTKWLKIHVPVRRFPSALGPASRVIFGTSSKSANSTIFGTCCTQNSLVFQPCGERPK